MLEEAATVVPGVHTVEVADRLTRRLVRPTLQADPAIPALVRAEAATDLVVAPLATGLPPRPPGRRQGHTERVPATVIATLGPCLFMSTLALWSD